MSYFLDFIADYFSNIPLWAKVVSLFVIALAVKIFALG